MLPPTLKFDGRVLYLSEDQEQLKAQLYGHDRLKNDPARKLVDNISTDELTPGWVCY
jgi:3-isopropylmalate/(R)-2-methylmalate dehydratase large subunit